MVQLNFMYTFAILYILSVDDIWTQVSSQSLPCRTATGDNCPSVICPNTVVSYTCTITGGTAAGNTDWILPTGTCPANPYPDKIRLSQLVSQQCSAVGSGGTPNMCGPYRASSIQSSDPTYCLSSILTVNITSTMNGSTVTCYNTNIFNTSITAAVSSATITVVGPPGDPIITNTSADLQQLTVTWSLAAAVSEVATTYVISISNDSYNNTLTPLEAYTYTFTGLISDTLYTVSVMTINCAGTSNVITAMKQTLASPPDTNRMKATDVFNPDSTLHQLEITWTPVGGSVTIYGVYVGGVLHGNMKCTTSPCFYVVPVSVPCNISVASINGGGIGPMSGIISSGSQSNHVLNSTVLSITVSTATIECSFLSNWSYYCLVCCNKNIDFISPNSSVHNISIINGTNVAVTLQGLTSNQTYYCRAAATNSSSTKCGDPVIGNVNMFVSFLTVESSPSMTASTSDGSSVIEIAIPVVVGAIAIVVVIVVAIIIRRWKKYKEAAKKCDSSSSRSQLDLLVAFSHKKNVCRNVSETAVQCHDGCHLGDDKEARVESPIVLPTSVQEKVNTTTSLPSKEGCGLSIGGYEDTVTVSTAKLSVGGYKDIAAVRAAKLSVGGYKDIAAVRTAKLSVGDYDDIDTVRTAKLDHTTGNVLSAVASPLEATYSVPEKKMANKAPMMSASASFAVEGAPFGDYEDVVVVVRTSKLVDLISEGSVDPSTVPGGSLDPLLPNNSAVYAVPDRTKKGNSPPPSLPPPLKEEDRGPPMALYALLGPSVDNRKLDPQSSSAGMAISQEETGSTDVYASVAHHDHS